MHVIRDSMLGFRIFGGTRQWFEFSPRFGLGMEIELPSEWHEYRSITLSWCLIWGTFYVMIPCWRTWPDYHQCAGPRYGFKFFEDLLFIHYGNDDGTRQGSRTKVIDMPWSWGSAVRRDTLTKEETHPYRYVLRSGEVQDRTATIYVDEMEWRRWWWPSRRVIKSIDVTFDDEVGERTGSWKGGTIGCGYTMKPGERPVDTLRRMERERIFD